MHKTGPRNEIKLMVVSGLRCAHNYRLNGAGEPPEDYSEMNDIYSTALQIHDSKFDSWRAEAEYT